eukprot:g21523.t1
MLYAYVNAMILAGKAILEKIDSADNYASFSLMLTLLSSAMLGVLCFMVNGDLTSVPSGRSGTWEKEIYWEKEVIVDKDGGHCSTADFLHREKGSECCCFRHVIPTHRGKVSTASEGQRNTRGSNEEAYDGKKQFKEWRRAVLLRLGEKGLEGALKPVNVHYRMVHKENVAALQSRGKEMPKYMWLQLTSFCGLRFRVFNAQGS